MWSFSPKWLWWDLLFILKLFLQYINVIEYGEPLFTNLWHSHLSIMIALIEVTCIICSNCSYCAGLHVRLIYEMQKHYSFGSAIVQSTRHFRRQLTSKYYLWIEYPSPIITADTQDMLGRIIIWVDWTRDLQSRLWKPPIGPN